MSDSPTEVAEVGRKPGILVSILAAALPISMVVWALDLVRHVGLLIYPEQFAAVVLGIALALVYLHVPAGAGNHRTGPMPWYDVLCAIGGFAVCIYVAINFPTFSTAALKSTGGLTAAFVLVPLLLEGSRRTAGLPITIVVILFLALGLSAHLLPGDLMGRKVSVESLAYYLTWNSTAILGLPLMVVMTVVVAFVLFGQALSLSGGADFFTDISMALMGRFRGGQAKIAIISSALFGTVSGSAVANVVAGGAVTIQLMKRGGYRAHVAAAIEAVSSTGGQIMPPVMGISAFLMAEFLQIPYAEIALAAMIPALIYFVALFVQADLEAARHGIERVTDENIPRKRTVIKAGWFISIPFVILVVGIFWLNYPLELAALYATVAVVICGLVFGYRGQRLRSRDIVTIVTTTGFGLLDIFMLAPLAGIVIGVLNISGLGFTLAMTLIALAGGSVLLLLLLTAIVSIILGMGMPTVGVYILLATLVAPALIQVGIDPMAAHLFIFYFGMLSMITPPIALAAFAAASLAGTDPLRTAMSSVRFGWTAFVMPFLFVFSPSLLLRASFAETAVDLVTALSGVWFICAAYAGYSLRRIPAWERAAYLVAGIGLMLPVGILEWSYLTNLLGAALGIGLLVLDWAQAKGKAMAIESPSVTAVE